MRIMELLAKSPSVPRLYGEGAYQNSFLVVMEKIESPTVSALLSEKENLIREIPPSLPLLQ